MFRNVPATLVGFTTMIVEALVGFTTMIVGAEVKEKMGLLKITN